MFPSMACDMLPSSDILIPYEYFPEEGMRRAQRATEAIFSKKVSALAQLSPVEMEQTFDGAPVVSLLLSPGITVLQLGLMAKCFSTESESCITFLSQNVKLV